MSPPIAVLAGAVAVAVAAYAAYVAVTWHRYGCPRHRGATDPLLDRFFPYYEVRECHERAVPAAAAPTLAAARELSFDSSLVVRVVFALRSIPARLLGASPPPRDRRGIVAETLSIGWGVLAETGGEIVMGAVTQPWKASVEFRALPPETFAAFSEPGYVKIAWTLRADPVGPAQCVFRTETRAIATDGEARARFRRYWAFLSPGILLIRHMILRRLMREVERSSRTSLRPAT